MLLEIKVSCTKPVYNLYFQKTVPPPKINFKNEKNARLPKFILKPLHLTVIITKLLIVIRYIRYIINSKKINFLADLFLINKETVAMMNSDILF